MRSIGRLAAMICQDLARRVSAIRDDETGVGIAVLLEGVHDGGMISTEECGQAADGPPRKCEGDLHIGLAAGVNGCAGPSGAHHEGDGHSVPSGHLGGDRHGDGTRRCGGAAHAAPVPATGSRYRRS